MQHQAGGMQHEGEHMQHGMVNPESQKYPTIAYDDARPARPIERPAPPKMFGDAKVGKTLAYDPDKGRCLSCHILEADGEQAGDVGPNLSTYIKAGRSIDYIFQQVWDARAHNPNTVMPPFGTHELLSKEEVMHIVAYLATMTTPVEAPVRPQREARNFYVAGEDFSFADRYIEQGEVLFRQTGVNGWSCDDCHEQGKAPDLKGRAANYPRYQASLKKVISLEDRINLCRSQHQASTPYPLGSAPSNQLSAYVKYLSRNSPIEPEGGTQTAAAWARGERSFYKKTGRLNLACADCHRVAATKWLRGQWLSAIRPGGDEVATAATWPRHFISGHDLGLISLQQRIRHCQAVTETFPQELGSAEYNDMELYMMTLARDMPMLAPTMSKLRGDD